MNGRTIWTIVLVLIVLGGVVWYFSGITGNGPEAPSEYAASSTPSAPETAPSGAVNGTSINPQSKNVTVTYTNQGFSPASVTIPEGATVTFVNQSSEDMWVASNVHPTHTQYDGTGIGTHCAPGYTGPAPFDECTMGARGTSYSFTFTQAGTWRYHNHIDPGQMGTVIVSGAGGSGSVNAAL